MAKTTVLPCSAIVPHRLPEVAAAFHVDARGGLVEQEQVGVADQRGRKPDALSLAAG